MQTITITVQLNAAGQLPHRNVFDEAARQIVDQALELNDGAITQTAEALGIYRQTLQRKLRKLRLEYFARRRTRIAQLAATRTVRP